MTSHRKVKNAGGVVSESQVPRSYLQPSSAKTGRFIRGSVVRVPLGARTYDATVIEERNGRVRVEIDVAGSDEPITSSYAIEELSAT
ncbi:hypothetical protein [Arthrobacter sp. JSM 101049]|uniref:hypothetical protein n=1 Tax=Arthrobacter sp. JSM 101049 TaxID=929097 RepID=UPI0035695E0E